MWAQSMFVLRMLRLVDYCTSACSQRSTSALVFLYRGEPISMVLFLQKAPVFFASAIG